MITSSGRYRSTSELHVYEPYCCPLNSHGVPAGAGAAAYIAMAWIDTILEVRDTSTACTSMTPDTQYKVGFKAIALIRGQRPFTNADAHAHVRYNARCDRVTYLVQLLRTHCYWLYVWGLLPVPRTYPKAIPQY